MNCLDNLSTPQLEKVSRGKVRESFRINQDTRLIAVTDRISSFDFVLSTPIPAKGAVINGIANHWFQRTSHLIPNHFIQQIDPNLTLVKEADPIRIEMIVRGYLTGSMWRGYRDGKRMFSGVSVPDGLTQNARFPQPLVTPTTKEDSDREISPDEIVKEGWTTAELYQKMKEASLKLFEAGTHSLGEAGLILVDTKYEFGLINGELILIDEIHTPDSSRFWDARNYQKDPLNVESYDKEFVRQWLIEHKSEGKYPRGLPEEVAEETGKRYLELYQRITGNELQLPAITPPTRIYHHLVAHQLIKEGYVAIVMGSPADEPHCRKIASYIEKYGIATQLRVVSAHKNGEQIAKMVPEYNQSVEPGVVIAVAGRSNGLGGALGANLNLPVINCPPFTDKLDLLLNINSSLIMPSKIATLTVIEPENAALAALRALNLPRLRSQFSQEISSMKTQLDKADEQLREQ